MKNTKSEVVDQVLLAIYTVASLSVKVTLRILELESPAATILVMNWLDDRLIHLV